MDEGQRRGPDEHGDDELDAERTQVIPAQPGPAAGPVDDQPTVQLRPGGAAAPTDRPPDEPFVIPPEFGLVDEPTDDPAPRRRVPRTLLVGAAVLVLLGLVYAGDLLLSRGDVPRGTVVAGEDVGGLDAAAAEEQLRAALSDRATAPVPVRAGDTTTELDPATAGLSIDWPATLAQAGDQPLNPLTRVGSFFTDRPIGIVTAVDEPALQAAVEGLRAQTDRPAVEGAVTFDGTTPVATEPAPGQVLDAGADAESLVARWFEGATVELPVQAQEPTVTSDGVAQALAVATPAVAGPVTATGKDGATTATLTPEQVATLLTFVPDGAGGLTPTFDVAGATGALAPQLEGTQTVAVDATVRISGGAPEVVPAVDGEVVDWNATLADPLALLTGPTRSVAAVYVTQPAAVTTEAAQAYGITEVIGEFTTGGFASASGVNIRRGAEEINGALVLPGAEFSLNGYTGPRGTDQGYVESGIISNGRAGTGVGGGISQLATTLYNATYFAGMTDVEHREHSYYISRYPAGREATVFEGSIDVRFGNPYPTAVLIETIGTSSDITVRIWGTKTVDVESVGGPRTSYTSPGTVTIPAGESCSPSGGAQGFTVTDTRIIRDAGSGAEIDRETRTVVYNPQPRVVCAPPPEPAPAPPAAPVPSTEPVPLPGG